MWLAHALRWASTESMLAAAASAAGMPRAAQGVRIGALSCDGKEADREGSRWQARFNPSSKRYRDGVATKPPSVAIHLKNARNGLVYARTAPAGQQPVMARPQGPSRRLHAAADEQAQRLKIFLLASTRLLSVRPCR